MIYNFFTTKAWRIGLKGTLEPRPADPETLHMLSYVTTPAFQPGTQLVHNRMSTANQDFIDTHGPVGPDCFGGSDYD